MPNKKQPDNKRYIINPTNNCWEYQMGIHKKTGYGAYHLDRKPLLAHRYYYEKANGKIRKGLVIDHLCRNRACVNPTHMRAVEQKENVRNKINNKLTYKDINNIKYLSNKGNTHRKIAKIYNINPCHVSRILSGLRWA